MGYLFLIRLSAEESANLVLTCKLLAPNLMGYLLQSVSKVFFHREPSTMPNDLLFMLRKANEDNYKADCFFIVEGKEIAAHKAIVCTRCDYFRYFH